MLSVGGTAITGGAVLGSGAFSQVEADRDVSVTLADDSVAYLTMSAGSGSGEFVDETGNAIAFDFGDLGENYGDGLNDTAVSSFDSLLNLENAGTNDVEVSFSVADADGADTPEGIRLYTGSATDDSDTDLTGVSLAAFDDSGTEQVEAESVEVGFEIDTNVIETTGTYTVTITATETTA